MKPVPNDVMLKSPRLSAGGKVLRGVADAKAHNATANHEQRIFVSGWMLSSFVDRFHPSALSPTQEGFRKGNERGRGIWITIE